MIGKLYALRETRGHLIAFIFRLYWALYAYFVLAAIGDVMDFAFTLFFIFIAGVYVSLTFNAVRLGSIKACSLTSLVADTFFIIFFFLAYGKFDTYSLTVAILPIIGNICLSDFHFSKLLAVTVPASIFVTLYYKGISVFWPLVLPFVVMALIVMFSELHEEMNTKIVKIGELMDSFFINKENLQKSFKIYEHIIKVLKKEPLAINIDAVYCFLNDDKVYLYNGSRYVWSYTFAQPISQTGKTNDDKFNGYTSFPLFINDQEIKENRRFVVTLDSGVSYMFVVVVGEVGYFTRLLMNITLQTLFSKLAKLYESERLLNNIESKKLMELSEKANYVNAAVSSLHFMRNKLSPMKTLFSIVDEMKVETDEARRDKMRFFMEQDINKMRESYKLMIDRANLLLDDSETPFIYSSLQRYTLKDLFTETRQCWQDYRLDESSITIKLLEDGKGENCYVFYNSEGLGLVIDNWISNISKYSVGSYSLELLENENNVILTFSNGFDSKTSLGFVRCYSKDNRAEINRNKWHGLSNIKDFLEQMHLQGEISKDDANIYFKIIFPKAIEDEEGADN